MPHIGRAKAVLAMLTLALVGLTTLAGWAWSVSGLNALGWLGAGEAGRPQLERRVEAVDFDWARHLPLNPNGGGFRLKLEGWLLPPEAGPLELAVVSLGAVRLEAGGSTALVPGLGARPWPEGWRVAARPGGDPAPALDRDPRTRWASGRGKRGDEELKVEFARPERVLGVVLDSAGGGPRECPAAWRLESWERCQGWTARHEAQVPGVRAGAVDAFPEPFETRKVKVRQSGRADGFWWGVNELYLITDSGLAAGALACKADGPLKLSISYAPPPEEAGPQGISRGYGLLRLYLRQGGGPWRLVPTDSLARQPLAGGSARLYRTGRALGPWLAWLWVLAAAAWAWLLARRPAPDASPEAEAAAPRRLWLLIPALALGWVLAGLVWNGPLDHFGRTFLFGVGADSPPDAWAWGLALVGLGALAGGAAWLAGKRPLTGPLAGLAAGAALAMAWLWLDALGLDAPLTAHDHGVFLFSHWLWDRLGPATTNYLTRFNAGVLEWEAVRNGSAAAWVLARPLTAVLDIQRAYTLFTPLIFAIMTPWAVFGALRAIGLGRGAAALGGLMALMPHTNWAFWLAMGANSGLIAAVSCLAALLLALRLLEDDQPRLRHALALTGVLTLALFWLPSALALLLPGPALLLIHWRSLKGRRLGLLALSAGLATLATLAWLLPFWRHYALGGFAAQAWHWRSIDWGLAGARWLSLATDVNPLIWLPGLAGLASLPPRRRLALGVYLANLIVVIGLVAQEMPALQLHRLELFWSLALIWPAAAWYQALWRRTRTRNRRALVAGLVAPLLSLSLAATGLYYSQQARGREIRPLDGTLEALATWLGRREAPPGRVLLAGRSADNWHGYPAWMTLYCRRPLIADFYAGILIRDREVTLPRELCMDPPSPADFARLLALYDVGQVVADRLGPDSRWSGYLAELPFLEPILSTDGRYTVYAFRGGRGPILEGGGKVYPGLSDLDILPGPGPRMILSYAWVPGLTAGPDATVEPVEVWPGVRFIALTRHSGRPVRVEME